MARLKLFLLKTEDSELATAGDIWVQNAPDGASPVVSGVIARLDAGSKFVLPPGRYTYRFGVDAGKGKFTVEIDLDADRPAKLIAFEYDTADSLRGRTLRFQVQ